MEKNITIKELREQLQGLENLGMGQAVVIFCDSSNIDHKVEVGVYDIDTCENKLFLK